MDFSFIYVSDYFRGFLIKGNVCNPYQLWDIAEPYSMQSMKFLLLFGLGVVPSSFCALWFLYWKKQRTAVYPIDLSCSTTYFTDHCCSYFIQLFTSLQRS